MPTFSNAGGSLGSAIVLTLLAWGVRWVRAEMSKRRALHGDDAREQFDVGPLHARVSVSTLLGLLETRACGFLLIDVRPFSERRGDDNDMSNGILDGEEKPLPRVLRGAIRLPFDLIKDVLASAQAWEATFPHVKCPDTFKILVLLGDTEVQELKAASSLNALGYQRTLCVRGCLQSCSADEIPQSNLQYISRDGLALLISEASFNTAMDSIKIDESFVLIDVRRRDEIILFGSIPGFHNVPVDEIASALLNLKDAEFEQMYHFKKPNKNVLLIMCSRTFARATWAAQIAQDAGYIKVAVYAQGVNGWNLDPSIYSYPSYAMGDPPPEAEEYEAEMIHHSHGMAELANLFLESLQQEEQEW